MDENIYKKLFFVLIIILIGIIIFNIIQQKPICLLHSCQDKQEEKKIVINIEPKNEPKFVPRLVLDPRIAFDDQTLRDPLLPPRTRDDWNVPLPAISTRGYPSPYHKLGMLINSTADNSDKFKFLFLMGRRKFPNSSYYNYYVTDANNEKASLKFDLPDLHKELYTGDTIKITELGNTVYTVQMDKLVDLEYNPYVI
jgi:hypothetical protein